MRISNAKREEKELPKLKVSCPFCRALPHSNASEVIDQLKALILKLDAMLVPLPDWQINTCTGKVLLKMP